MYVYLTVLGHNISVFGVTVVFAIHKAIMVGLIWSIIHFKHNISRFLGCLLFSICYCNGIVSNRIQTLVCIFHQDYTGTGVVLVQNRSAFRRLPICAKGVGRKCCVLLFNIKWYCVFPCYNIISHDGRHHLHPKTV